MVGSTTALFSHGPQPLEHTLDYDGDPGLLGPDSVSWRVIGDAAAFVGGIRALLVQTAHPEVVAGVEQHSRYRADPLERLSVFRGGAAYYEEFRRIMRRATAGYELRLVPVVATRFIRPPDTSNSWTRNASPTEGPTWLTSDQTCTWAQSSRGKAPGRSRRVCNTRQMSMRSPNGT